MNLWKLGTFFFAGLLVTTVAVGSITLASADPQPQMRSALDNLVAAKGHLQKATADKGGHRVKAIELTDAAIEQVKKGIEFDNKH